MHAYLITGNNISNIDEAIFSLAKKINSKILEFSLLKVEDVRSLNDFIRFSFAEPTLIVSKNIDNATTEALNAFLKNLEEPGENISFALTALSSGKVLPTIISRCQIINLFSDSGGDFSDIEAFLGGTAGQKLLLFDKMIKRDIAVNFIEKLLTFLHNKREFKNMDLILKTLTGLKGNGNVNLQLTNLVVNYK
jgi:hypothetical protein